MTEESQFLSDLAAKLRRVPSELIDQRDIDALFALSAHPAFSEPAAMGGEAIQIYRWRFVDTGAEWSDWFSGSPPDSDDIETETRTLYTHPAPSETGASAMMEEQPANSACRLETRSTTSETGASLGDEATVLRLAAAIVERLPWHNAETIAHRMRNAALEVRSDG